MFDGKMERLNMNLPEIDVQRDRVYSYPVHMHSYFEMTLYQPFSGSVSINGVPVQIDTVTAILITPSDFHEIETHGATGAEFIKISFERKLLTGAVPDFSLYAPLDASDGFTARLFEEILTSRDNEYRRPLINAAVCRLMKTGRRMNAAPGGSGSMLARKAIAMINEGFCGDIGLSAAARQLSVTPEYLSSVFKRSFGIGFSRYICDLRLSIAAQRLRSTDDSVTDICYSCGYRNLSHFLRSFRDRYGVSPGRYREGAAQAEQKP